MKTQNISVFLLVGLGGAIGAVLRFLVAEWTPQTNFPMSTIIVNLIGCFILGYITFQPWIRQKLTPAAFTGLSTGIIGSFTTFSTFIAEGWVLTENNIIWAVGYLLLTMIGGLLSCWLGIRLSYIKE
ncbi:fluoride efflux transporter FluC [Gracilibacillus alcaliphilus]|uniref:fluoride efflux transporter FluC n=1 Tax=Gracilibacillus alcaliphilus TaxID=1401441 RepID=UPI00195A41D1|nr:CrcB family protein [Gracilibacillus alcaliphilus]MBM7675927.1 CrcB protein [Gracilibacillus alcaliphilus]